jgi:hypothetical protein
MRTGRSGRSSGKEVTTVAHDKNTRRIKTCQRALDVRLVDSRSHRRAPVEPGRDQRGGLNGGPAEAALQNRLRRWYSLDLVMRTTLG